MELEAATGLPADLIVYAPDARVYDAMLATDGPPAWLDEIDLRPGPPFHHVGTHAATDTEWLCADAAREMELALRNRLLDERREVVFGCLPSAEDSATTTLALVIDWLRGQGIAHTPPDPAEHPLVAAGRLVQDDLCLMVRRDGAWHLDAGVLCFPSMWQLHDRLGLPLDRVHEHVAHYGDEIGERVDRFFDRLPADRVVWRRNVSIKPYPHLYLPLIRTEPRPAAIVAGEDGSPFWIRSERQTLLRLADHEAIVFAIRVQLTPARTLLERPDIAARLHRYLTAWDDALREYKMSDRELYAAFVSWLGRIAPPR